MIFGIKSVIVLKKIQGLTVMRLEIFLLEKYLDQALIIFVVW